MHKVLVGWPLGMFVSRVGLADAGSGVASC